MTPAILIVLLALGSLAAGLLIGRYYVPEQRELKRRAIHALIYARTINHLLARDRDSAIDELIAIVNDDVVEVEPYFALGALFRSRGEWERAIRVHQALDMREGADKRIRFRARYALGLDFRAAHMPLRAIRAFEQCLEIESKDEGSLKALGSLYEERGEFVKAAGCWHILRKIRKEKPALREHLLWVAAAEHETKTDGTRAREFLGLADKAGKSFFGELVWTLQLDRDEAQADASSRLAAAANKYRDNTPFLDFLASAKAQSAGFERGIRTQWVATISKVSGSELAPSGDDEVAAAFAKLEAHVAGESSAGTGGDVGTLPEPLRDAVRTLVESFAWRCQRCGFTAEEHAWRCSECKQWLTFVANRRPAGMHSRERRANSRLPKTL